MEINEKEFKKIIDIKEIEVQVNRSSEIIPMRQETSHCVIIQHTAGTSWVSDQGNFQFSMSEDKPGLISKKISENFNIRPISSVYEESKKIKFTLIFIKIPE